MLQGILYGGKLESPISVTLGELVIAALEKHGTRTLLVDSTTYEEYSGHYILKYSTKLAEWLYSQGLKQGDIIALMSENRVEFLLVTIAAVLRGITVAPLSPGYTIEELQHLLSLFKPKLIFSSPNIIQRITPLLDIYSSITNIVVFGRDIDTRHSKIISMELALEDYCKNNLEENKWISPKLDRKENIAVIMCSSGTTGMPKGVMITQHNLLIYFASYSQFRDGKLEKGFEAIGIGVYPFCHSAGFNLMLFYLLKGVKCVILRRFQFKQFLKMLQDFKVSVLSVPAPVLTIMCQSPLLEEYDLSNIREIRYGVAHLPNKFQREIVQKINVKSLIQGYGMTEMTLCATMMPPNVNKCGSVGKLLPEIYAKVIDERGRILGPNQQGELCFKGPVIMKGYINDPISTANAIDKDGWLHSGDIGYYDNENYFYIVDRIKEIIKYKGHQVAPAELEHILMSHPDLLDVAVIGLPDDLAGEVPLAFVVLKPNATTTAKEIQDFVKGKASPPKQLRGGVKFIESIPRNSNGKILRRLLMQSVTTTKSRL